jgi:hypothetical protein
VLAALKRQAWPEEAGAANAWPTAFHDSRQWCFLSLKPGTDPLKALIESFLDTWQFAATDPERVTRHHGWMEALHGGKATLPWMPVPYLASFGNEVVVRIDHKKCSDVPLVSDFCHRASDLGRPSQGAGVHKVLR